MYTLRKDIKHLVAKAREENALPTGRMEVGESYLFPINKITSIRSSARYFAMKNGWKFQVGIYDKLQGVCIREK